jgi:hypothetical protein
MTRFLTSYDSIKFRVSYERSEARDQRSEVRDQKKECGDQGWEDGIRISEWGMLAEKISED